MYRVAVEVEPLKNRTPFPTKTPSISARCSHILRGGTFLLSPAERFPEIKSGTTDLNTVPDAEELSPQEAQRISTTWEDGLVGS